MRRRVLFSTRRPRPLWSWFRSSVHDDDTRPAALCMTHSYFVTASGEACSGCRCSVVARVKLWLLSLTPGSFAASAAQYPVPARSFTYCRTINYSGFRNRFYMRSRCPAARLSTLLEAWLFGPSSGLIMVKRRQRRRGRVRHRQAVPSLQVRFRRWWGLLHSWCADGGLYKFDPRPAGGARRRGERARRRGYGGPVSNAGTPVAQ